MGDAQRTTRATDIVFDLRCAVIDKAASTSLMNEAADEIERMRDALTHIASAPRIASMDVVERVIDLAERGLRE